jgi:very-short-patch-repair endonuclease
MVRDRMARGLLVRLHPGVYAVGHRQLRTEAHSLAAVLAIGAGAVLSHRDAAWLHGLRPSNRRQIDVATTRRGRRTTPTIHVHRTTVLTAADVTTIDRIPVTSLARTLVDLAGVVPRDHLERVLKEADRRRVLDLTAVDAVLERTRQRNGRGRAAIVEALDRHRALALQLDAEALERLMLEIVEDYGLPTPLIRHMVDGREIDACWPRSRVAVELDGWKDHHHRRAFQHDREKANMLTTAGWIVLRFTHHDLAHRPAYVAEQIRRVL